MHLLLMKSFVIFADIASLLNATTHYLYTYV